MTTTAIEAQAREDSRRAVRVVLVALLLAARSAPASPEPVPARKARRRRKGGSLYLRGGVWWIKYYVDGRPIRETTGSARREDAETRLDERFGQRAAGEPISPKAARLRVDELLDNLDRRYRIDGARWRR
jgi:hypothetical protein